MPKNTYKDSSSGVLSDGITDENPEIESYDYRNVYSLFDIIF